MEQEEKINWDKLLKHLEGKNDLHQDEELNQEELEVLLLAEEINMRIKEEDPRHKFPVQEGWEELKQRYQEKNAAVKQWKLSRILTAAAIFLLIQAPVWWLVLRQGDPSVAPVSDQVQLTLANGQTVELDPGKAELLKTEGAALNGTNLVYKPETALAAKGQELHTNVLFVPKGKYTRMEMSDGTTVWLNAGSSLSYPVPFAAGKREVTLEGEAYFEVKHNAARPFIVHLKAMDVKVLGTAFSVSTFGNQVNTALDHGKISLQAGNHSLILLPGELGVYHQESGSLTKSETDLRLYTAWKDQDVYFNDNTLDEITTRLAREYNVSFIFEQESLKKLHFTVDMPKQADLNKILNNIRFSSDQVDFVNNGNVIKVKQR
ncbi:transmembrane sensor [Pedobacter africanus]|uniref:Ferric-dicitrate binding protein FerR (Iron transport regulator) n=1 Tax=Pedobacter africanus TaxID=151894 RepID=A0ACC6L1Z2_9SPHI|nr:FecR domain-containing protein [Pedobacter africanus]MDR6785392.1 ferric-dicitrate binding protein FerR (iron transport regulator) [Pedobacter africanus]